MENIVKCALYTVPGYSSHSQRSRRALIDIDDGGNGMAWHGMTWHCVALHWPRVPHDMILLCHTMGGEAHVRLYALKAESAWCEVCLQSTVGIKVRSLYDVLHDIAHGYDDTVLHGSPVQYLGGISDEQSRFGARLTLGDRLLVCVDLDVRKTGLK